MTSVEYNPAASFDVEITDRIYLETRERQPAGDHLPAQGAKGHSQDCWTFTVAGGSSAIVPATAT